MSNILMIRHLPDSLTFEEKQQLLKHFGAQKVWETKSKRNYVFASFTTREQAKSSLIRLHQLEIARRRLVVEYSHEDMPYSLDNYQNEQCSAITKHIKEFLRNLNAWNPSVDFYQPPPPCLKYKYPEPTSQVIINIIYAMITHKPLYTQILHLMNKMGLDPPFQNNEQALNDFKNMFRDIFVDELQLIPQPVSEEESELSSDEAIKTTQADSLPKMLKRKHILPKTRKRPAAVLSMATIPKGTKKIMKQKEVFEEVTLHEPKKISVVVPQDVLGKQTQSQLEVAGEIGKFHKEDKTVEISENMKVQADKPIITKKELLKNRISYRDMKLLPVFKNYHPGPPSMRLYIKNLAKTVTEADVKQIYQRYIEGLSEDQQIGFDVRVMQEGRMKGQGFVTFPSIALAEVALNETNGYNLQEKPMVVQFARVASKKPVE